MTTFQDLVNKAAGQDTDTLLTSFLLLEDCETREEHLTKGAIITVLESRGVNLS